MALSRKFLSALGIEADKIDEIIEAHTDTVNALKDEREKYKADAEKLPAVQKELDTLKEAAQKNGENPYKAQYEALKKEYDEYKADVEAKEIKARKEKAYRGLLKDVGISEKRMDAIMRVSSISEIELDKDGKAKNEDDLKEKIKKEWADFIVKEGEKGAETQTPPDGAGSGGKTPSRAASVAKKYYGNVYGTKGDSE